MKTEKTLYHVKVAYLQAPVSFPGVFSTMTMLDKQKFPKLTMGFGDSGLTLQYGNQIALIPTTNIKLCVFEEPSSSEHDE